MRAPTQRATLVADRAVSTAATGEGDEEGPLKTSSKAGTLLESAPHVRRSWAPGRPGQHRRGAAEGGARCSRRAREGGGEDVRVVRRVGDLEALAQVLRELVEVPLVRLRTRGVEEGIGGRRRDTGGVKGQEGSC
ncbi:unnamed protein product [Prorocentrum cordatum]|uniref:Uncharacterized protein n=1 Tax=Prorocentrum cordatum TaxID=2364126 RepID=A0ABN9QHA4_9DINO|nr:unnamed protein product [Polarella glacialis]